MNKVEFDYSNKYKRYFLGDTLSAETDRLAMFLCSDVRDFGTSGWREWLNDINSHYECCANLTCLVKRGSNISIYHEMDDEDDENAPCFTTSIENLKYILDCWDQALKEKPQRVIITQDDNDNITVTFEN